jgi:PhnB protein
MSKVSLDPYLFFNGNAKEAMEFYKSVFGGDLTMQMMDEAPDFPGKEKMKGQVMHAALRGDFDMFASDSQEASAKSAKVELCLGGSDEAKLRQIFDALSEGGKVRYPLKKEFWEDIFGTLTDKYGIDWMINISTKK